jgi:hypothetical protein
MIMPNQTRRTSLEAQSPLRTLLTNGVNEPRRGIGRHSQPATTSGIKPIVQFTCADTWPVAVKHKGTQAHE